MMPAGVRYHRQGGLHHRGRAWGIGRGIAEVLAEAGADLPLNA